uniref:NADH dehydrogenase subunit 6 n=1 Tax=Alboglossiphonia lata TaxID=321034 RepID=UPI0023D803F6|nr:NADH dehydrogenase subunit 6 [Alboglossiphonia lata]WDA96102.1 NADH dehydrogenase subunit 6 [Alboglossiphonia lata]
MYLMLTINMLLASFLTMTTLFNPFTMALNILMISLLTAWIYAFNMSSWYAFLIYIIYVGGMLVMFAYFVTLSPNQKLKIKSYFLTFIMTFLVLMMPLMMNKSYWPSKNNQIYDSQELYNFLNLSVVMLIVFLLLVILLMVVKMINTSKGPLRPFMYV